MGAYAYGCDATSAHATSAHAVGYLLSLALSSHWRRGDKKTEEREPTLRQRAQQRSGRGPLERDRLGLALPSGEVGRRGGDRQVL
jgi:hypothetical protein